MTATSMQGDRPPSRVRHTWRCLRRGALVEVVKEDATGHARIVEQCQDRATFAAYLVGVVPAEGGFGERVARPMDRCHRVPRRCLRLVYRIPNKPAS